MKKTFVIAALAVAAISCSKELPTHSVSTQNVESNLPASLTVSIESPLSKATVADTADEAKVNTLEVFVFKADGEGTILDAYGSSTSTSVTLSASIGQRTVWAVVNADSGLNLSSVKTENELKAKVSELANNSSSSFVMTGSKAVTLNTTNSVSVPVERIAARIIVKKVTFSLPAAFDGVSKSVNRVYLTHVAGKCTIGGTAPATQTWFATSTLGENGGQKNLILQSWNETNGVSLYCYPNSSETRTKIVVEVVIDSKTYTYPIGLVEGVASNTSYEIRDLVITRPGNPSNGDDTIDNGEDDIVSTKYATFSLDVKDWNLVLLGSSGTVTL